MSTFMGVFKVPGAGVAPRPNINAEHWNFLKLLKTMIVWVLWFCLGHSPFVLSSKKQKKDMYKTDKNGQKIGQIGQNGQKGQNIGQNGQNIR